MQPMSPELRARIIAVDPSLEADLDEYQQLLGQRFSAGPGAPVNPRIDELWGKLGALIGFLTKLTPEAIGRLNAMYLVDQAYGVSPTGIGDKTLAKPELLTGTGEQAYTTILEVLVNNHATKTDGLIVFHHPMEWASQGYVVGKHGVLVVSFNDTVVAPFFSLDACCERYRMHPVETRYESFREMRSALAAIGLHSEESTGEYFATIYGIPVTDGKK